MRTTLAYTSARILMFVAALVLLYLAGARGILLLGLALVISALASYILLNKQRQVMAGRLNGRLSKVGSKATSRVSEFRERLEEGAAAEDAERAAGPVPAGTSGTAPAGTAPGSTTPADGVAAGTVSAGTAPAGTAPVGTAPAVGDEADTTAPGSDEADQPVR